MILAKSHSY